MIPCLNVSPPENAVWWGWWACVVLLSLQRQADSEQRPPLGATRSSKQKEPASSPCSFTHSHRRALGQCHSWCPWDISTFSDLRIDKPTSWFAWTLKSFKNKDDPQTAKQLYQRNSCTVKKVLGPTTGFPTWGSGKGTENPQKIWVWRPVGFDCRTYTGLGKQTLGVHKQNLEDPGELRQSQKTDPDLPVSVQESPAEAWVGSGLLQGEGHWV